MLKIGITYKIIFSFMLASMLACKSNEHKKVCELPQVIATSAMKNIMWKGELFGKIQVDTLHTKGLYGIGPEAFLTGEILINNGVSYVSKVLPDSTMLVVKKNHIEAPFFVHSHVQKWTSTKLPKSITSIKDIETYITELSQHIEVPFAFKLEGQIDYADIHIQNLPVGTEIRSPKQAHQGQVSYKLTDETVTIIGFYSKNHQGVFTHHDAFIHMHLITDDESKMGHIDALTPKDLTLFLPKAL